MSKLAGFRYSNFRSIRAEKERHKREVSPLALACREDFLLFRSYVCDHASYAHHKGWEGELNTGRDSRVLPGCAGPHTLILAPRGSSKSTYLVEWVAWTLGRAIERKMALKILYIAYSAEISAGKSEQIKAIITSPRYQEVFPWVRRNPSRWGSTRWDIDRRHAGLTETDEPYTLAIAGLAGAVTSRRSHLIVLDDLIRRPQDIENPDVRSKMSQNWTRVILPTLVEGGRAVCLGTRMLFSDIYATTMTRDLGWNVIEEQAILFDHLGREYSYCPELFSLDYLRQVREQDPDGFVFQYQNRIPENQDLRFRQEWLRFGRPPKLRDFEEIAIGCDLSASLKESADYTCFILAGRVGTDVWILDMVRGRWAGNQEKCDVILGLLLEWDILTTEVEYELDGTGRPIWSVQPKSHDFWPVTHSRSVTCYFDANAYQLSFRADFEGYINGQLGIDTLYAYPMKAKGDKLSRLRSVTGLFQAGQVTFNRARDMSRLVYELNSLGMCDHDDCADSMTYALRGMQIPRLKDV